ncbi:MAG: carboxypeptidase M32 [Dongiaceae bacterium]
MSAYTELESRFRRLHALRDAGGVLHWDMSAMMPPGGAAARAEQLAALQVVCHGILADPKVADLLDAAESEAAGLDVWQAANLAEMRWQWSHATALDAALVEALSKAVSSCEGIWRQARPASDYAMVRPALAEVLALVREAAQARAARLGCAPYDALLDEYEPGARAAEIDLVFDALAAFLPGLREEAVARQAARPAPLTPPGPFPAAAQRALAERLMRTIGFDFDHGRLDTSLHPFCGGAPDDVRITTRYDEDDFASALLGVLHETGHALYERGLPAAWRYQPVGRARGMALHESQSLLLEMQACRSRGFVAFLAPRLRDAFAGAGPAWEAENLYRLYTRVRPGTIRVSADELTYPAHIVLRYRLEKALIAGDLDLKDLPAAWNDGMGELLGVTPPDDREGCLQDIHWYDGAWGYFPTYTLGAVTAAQLFDAAGRADAAIPEAIGRGDFAPLVAWLGVNVHALASSLPGSEIVRRATGRPLGVEAFECHLRRRYLE